MNLDVANVNYLSGWVVNSKDSSRIVDVQLFVNGVLFAYTKADMLRPDIAEAGIGKEESGFEFLLNDLVLADVQSLVLKAGEQVLTSLIPADLGYDVKANDTVKAVLDVFSPSLIKGWACNTADFSHRPKVRCFVNGKCSQSTTAQQARPDVASLKFGDGNFGFEIELDVSQLEDKNTDLAIVVDQLLIKSQKLTAEEIIESKRQVAIKQLQEKVQQELDNLISNVAKENKALGTESNSLAGTSRVLLKSIAEINTRLSIIEEKALSKLAK